MERTLLVGMALSLTTVGIVLGAPSSGHAKPYKGAEVYSSQAYRYGRMEMRMRMARGSGLLSTFFTYKSGSELESTFWEEIDIEVFGKNDVTEWQSNIITGLGSRTTSEEVHAHTFSLADDYHTYALEWTPDYVAWEVDGVVVRQTTGGQASDLTSPQTLRFNIWAANDAGWVGAFDEAALPQYQYVNWISYYRYEGGQFMHEWTDEFDAFDGGRWGRANWTFAENLADFDPNNAVVRDGTLVLALTREGQTGFSGTVPLDDGENTGGTGGTGGSGGSDVGGTAGLGGSGIGGDSDSGGTGLGSGGVGGDVGAGGAAASSGEGGTPATGGAAATGGIAGTGGLQATGGESAVGGGPSSGGSTATGGTGDVGTTGGNVSTGGATPATGGAGNATGDAASAGTTASGADAGPTATDSSTDEGGCGCRIAGERSNSTPLTALGVLGLLALRPLRRRRTAART